MKFLRKIGFSLLLLNLLIGVPVGWLYLTNNVQIYSICVANSDRTSINFGEVLPLTETCVFYKWSSSHPTSVPRVWEQRLNSDRKLDRPAFEFKGAKSLVVSEIRLRRSWIFERILGPKEIFEGFSVSSGAEISMTNGDVSISSPQGYIVLSAKKDFVWPTPKLVRDRMTFLLIGMVEFAFIVLVFLGCRFVGPASDCRYSWMVSSTVAVFVCAFFALCIPLQTYLGNRASYGMGVGSVLSIIIPVFIGTTASATLLLQGLSKTTGFFIHLVLVAVVVYEYLQTGILMAGAPAMNGTTGYYGSWFLKVRDMAVLGTVVGGAIVGYRIIVPYILWVCAGVAVMSSASLLDVRPAPMVKDADSSYEPYLYTKETVANNLQLSTNRNVLWFVLDACTSEVAQDLIEHEGDVAKALDGFTLFSNSIGMHPYTNFALPGYVSGRYLRHASIGVGAMEYKDECYGTNTLFEAYREKDIPAAFIPSAYYYGYRYPSIAKDQLPVETRGNATTNPFFWRGSEPPAFTLFEMIRFRLTPAVIKCRHIDWLYSGMDFKGSTDDEAVLFPKIASAQTTNAQTALMICHTRGGHWPYLIDETGASLANPTHTGYRPYYNQVHFAFRALDCLFKQLRQKSVFDNSWIIISGDHGQDDFVHSDLEEKGVPNRASVMMLVKPPQSRGAVIIDEKTPTSMARMHSLLRALASSDPTLDEVSNLLSEEKRHYVWPADMPGVDGWQEWEIDANRACRKIR